MPYKNPDELPESVKDNLPKHTQDIDQAAFNSVWDTYEDHRDRKGDDNPGQEHEKSL